MKINNNSNTSEVRAEQVTNRQAQANQAEAIYLGIDLHKVSISITRIIDHSTPQPAQRFTWAKFWGFAQKQSAQAKKVYAVYEAGAIGFWVQRKLQEMGIQCYVIHTERLDPQHKLVQTGKFCSNRSAQGAAARIWPADLRLIIGRDLQLPAL